MITDSAIIPNSESRIVIAHRELQRYGAGMLEEGVFVPDASALLRLYECSPREREDLLEAFSTVKNRTWIAHRTRLEVLRKLPMVRSRNRAAIPHIEQALSRQLRNLVSQVSRRGDMASAYNVSSLIEDVFAEADLFSKISDRLLIAERTSFAAVDKFLDDLLMDGNVGPPLDPEDFDRVLRTGPNRLDAGTPPGFADLHKLESRTLEDALGDLIFWEQVLRFASNRRRSIIVVTAEEKDDWWKRIAGVVSPHPLMIEEMFRRSGRAYGALRVRDFVSVVLFAHHAKSLEQAIQTLKAPSVFRGGTSRSFPYYIQLTGISTFIKTKPEMRRLFEDMQRSTSLNIFLGKSEDIQRMIADARKGINLGGLGTSDTRRMFENMQKSTSFSVLLSKNENLQRMIADTSRGVNFAGLLGTSDRRWMFENMQKSTSLSVLLSKNEDFQRMIADASKGVNLAGLLGASDTRRMFENMQKGTSLRVLLGKNEDLQRMIADASRGMNFAGLLGTSETRRMFENIQKSTNPTVLLSKNADFQRMIADAHMGVNLVGSTRASQAQPVIDNARKDVVRGNLKPRNAKGKKRKRNLD